MNNGAADGSFSITALKYRSNMSARQARLQSPCWAEVLELARTTPAAKTINDTFLVFIVVPVIVRGTVHYNAPLKDE